MNVDYKRMVADHLLPGFGFFGATDPFALRVDVNAEIRGVALTIRAPRPEFLNIGSIEFFGRNGEIIDRAELVKAVVMSSTYGDVSADSCRDQVVEGRLFHTGKEAAPRVEITFKLSVEISHLVVRNRGDGNGRRSRCLNVEALSDEGWSLIYENDTVGGRRQALDELCAISGVELNLTSTADILPEVERVREGLRRKFEAAPPEMDFLSLCRLLPLHLDAPGTTDFHLLVLATIVLKLIGGRGHVPTALLRPLRPVLSSSIVIERVQAEATRLHTLWTGTTAPVALTKHGIHKSCPMLERREEYLRAMDQACETLEGLGVTTMLCYGSLLGAVRGGAFIPHDDDVDFLCFYGAKTREQALQVRQRLLEQLEDLGHRPWGIWKNNFHVTFNGCPLDFFICWSDGHNLELLMEHYRSRTIDHSIVLPPSAVKLYDRTYKAPANPTAFLEERYGAGWRRPDPYHEWPWEIERLEGDSAAPALREREPRRRPPRRSIGRTSMIAWGQRIGGARSSPPMNSLPIISRAIEVGFDAVELDVRVSRDGVPVLAHDDRLIGPDGTIVVTQSSLDQLSRFNLGFWRDRPCFVPTLSEALTLAGDKDVMVDPRLRRINFGWCGAP